MKATVVNHPGACQLCPVPGKKRAIRGAATAQEYKEMLFQSLGEGQ